MKVLSRSGVYLISSIQFPDRIYVGGTWCFSARWYEHKNRLKRKNHHSKYLQNHVNKYGIEDLVFTIKEFCDKSQLKEREQFYIDTLNPCFNMVRTAFGLTGAFRSEETREKQRQSMLNLPPDVKLRKRESRSKPVLQYNKDGIFIREFWGLKEAENISGVVDSGIAAVCNSTTGGRAVGGYMWKWKTDDNFPLKIEPYKQYKHAYPIIQRDMNGTLIKEWDSLLSIKTSLKICSKGIINCCKNRIVSYKGYIWEYKNKQNDI